MWKTVYFMRFLIWGLLKISRARVTPTTSSTWSASCTCPSSTMKGSASISLTTTKPRNTSTWGMDRSRPIIPRPTFRRCFLTLIRTLFHAPRSTSRSMRTPTPKTRRDATWQVFFPAFTTGKATRWSACPSSNRTAYKAPSMPGSSKQWYSRYISATTRRTETLARGRKRSTITWNESSLRCGST